MIDVIVVGGGNAALCAAISAAQEGAKVIVLESAPREWRGGNSQHTRNMRVAHDQPDAFLTDSYPTDTYFDDLLKVTHGETDIQLSRLLIEESYKHYQWMQSNGMAFQQTIKGTLNLSHSNAFFLGGGKTLVNTQYQIAKKLGVEVIYEREIDEVVIEGDSVRSITANVNGHRQSFTAKAYIFASGGFESNKEWLAKIWGEKAHGFLIRGSRFNRGLVLRQLLDKGVQSVGREEQCHAVAIDGRAPEYDGGIATRMDCVPLGIVLNKNGERFYDEGEDFWPKRYAIWGRLVAEQPDQVAFVLIDSKCTGLFMPTIFPATKAETIEELVEKLNMPAKAMDTIKSYNNSVVRGDFNKDVFDNCYTQNLSPNKTHWAQALDTPPYYGYLLKPGITFTYLGVKVNHQAQIQMASGKPLENAYCAGEMMAGNILGRGYLAGIGITIGGVFGRIAGREAAGAI